MKTNAQAPEKRVTGDGTVIAVNSIFHTIQGEGPFAGSPAVFVRLAGCNLQCPQCDTEYTHRVDMPVHDIVHAVKHARPHSARNPEPPYEDWEVAPCDLVVITGGEPFRQPIGLLVRDLRHAGYRVQIETNGTLYQPAFPYHDDGVTIVCSPKAGNVHRELVPWIAAFKYVASVDSLKDSPDGLPMHALNHACAPHLYRPPYDHKAEIFLQPVDEQDMFANAANRDAVVASCLRHGYRLCLQIHKDIGVP